MKKKVVGISILGGLLLFLRLINLGFTLHNQFFSTPEHIQAFNEQLNIHHDGTFDVNETIVYNFGATPHHGIYRTIPLTSDVNGIHREIKIHINNVEMDWNGEMYTENVNNGVQTIQIGNPSTTTSGVHTYTIDYSVSNQIGNFPNFDELYWNVTGNDWAVPINAASVVVTPDFPTTITDAKCFTGGMRSTDTNCTITKNTSFTTTKLLNNYEGLTIVTAFPAHTFPTSTLSQTQPSYTIGSLISPYVIPILIVIAPCYYILLPIGLLWWYMKHKHKNRFGKVTVNFDIPKDTKGNILTPMEAGTVDATKLEINDVVATVFDLAIRKHISITEVDKDVYRFNKLTKDTTILTLHEQQLLKWIFAGKETVKTTDLSDDLLLTFDDLEGSVFDSLVNKGLFIKDPKHQQSIIKTFAFYSFATLNIFTGILLLCFLKVFNGRTQDGDLVDWKIDGLKLFLKGMSKEYTWQSNQLALVEKMIPYAIAFGYVDKFMEQITKIYPNYQPTWYSGSHGFTVMPHNLFTSFQQSYTLASSSGFSGGGFSGGGGGGGGGGSW